jgi:tRNA dimethylallyltransferase
MEQKESSLVIIVGPTASGKSALALELAERYNGELICADSRTVYKGMDIGTAKPSIIDQLRVPHHMLDIVNPEEPFNVGQFKKQAEQLIKEIHNRGKLPMIVGGTGLYIDSVLYDYTFSHSGAAKDDINPRHLKRNASPSKNRMCANTLVIGLDVPKEVIEERISNRVDEMIEQGLEAEVSHLSQIYGWEAEAMTGVGYREWQGYYKGLQTLDQTRQLIVTHSRQYAKRQRTWFKRNSDINWISTTQSAHQIMKQYLQQNKLHNTLNLHI